MAMTPEQRLVRTVARREAKIVWNKAVVDALYAGMADAMNEIGQKIIDDARASAPRDPEKAAERGVPMMADTGSVSVWGQGKLVVGSGQRAASRNKPRGARTPTDQVVAFAMFSSLLSHLVELGTIKMNARPFLLPAFNRNIGGLASVVVPAMGNRAAGAAASVFSAARRPWSTKP